MEGESLGDIITSLGGILFFGGIGYLIGFGHGLALIKWILRN